MRRVLVVLAAVALTVSLAGCSHGLRSAIHDGASAPVPAVTATTDPLAGLDGLVATATGSASQAQGDLSAGAAAASKDDEGN